MKIPIQSHMLFSLQKPTTYATCYLIELCQIVVTLSEIHFILQWSRSRTRFHHILCFYTRSEQNFIHPQNKTPSPCMTPLSQKHIKDMGLCKKKIKDAYPKKVCHMLRHVKKKKREKMHTQRRYATCFGMSKKRENKRCIPKEGMPHA